MTGKLSLIQTFQRMTHARRSDFGTIKHDLDRWMGHDREFFAGGRTALLTAHSYIFDTRWYGDAIGQAGISTEDAILFFAQQAYSDWAPPPGPWFDAKFYAHSSPTGTELRSTGSALEHYLSIGARIHASPSPFFDASYYVRHYRGVQERLKQRDVRNALEDYMLYGCKQRLSPHPFFEEVWYVERYPAVARALDGDELLSGFHEYLVAGRFARRDPSPRFSERRYLGANYDVAAAVVGGEISSGFEHWLRHGHSEGRSRGHENLAGSALIGAG